MKDEISLQEYNNLINLTKVYPKEIGILYCSLGLAGESGEVCEKIKKIYRDNSGNITEEKRLEIAKEISDVIWYCTALSQEIGYSLQDILYLNKVKLMKRKETNTLHGEGDSREETNGIAQSKN